MQGENIFRSGFVAIIGRPNVGKSTLMNALVGEKIAIVSNRPQTTRNRIMGVVSSDSHQLVFLDTPGMHLPRTRLGEYMMQSVKESLSGIDVLTVIVDATGIGKQDHLILEEMSKRKIKKFLLINKIDLIPKENLLHLIESVAGYGFDEIIPISAQKQDGVDHLKALLIDSMPEGPCYFPSDTLTDQPERQLCAELIREKALLYLKDEVPHGIGVEMLSMKKISQQMFEIHATIYCERAAHKGIIIGKHGSMLKRIGQSARMDIEELLGMRVNLKLWIKVREDWRNRQEDLRTLGYWGEK